MKNVRMLLTGALVIAIVGGSLAFTKINPNLFQCVQNQCVGVNFSSFPSGPEVTATPYYTTDAATTNIDCFKPHSTTQGCSNLFKPVHAYINN
jgi:hypothetical protein